MLKYKDSFASRYYDNEAEVSSTLGFTITEPVSRSPEERDEDDLECEICQEEQDEEQLIENPTCGHRVCKSCMTNVCKIGVQSLSFVNARCPCGCGEPLTEEIISRCLSDTEMAKNRLWVVRTYMESSKHMRECHKDGCETFIEYHNDYSTQPILCVKCGSLWCWQCGQECHTPAACQQAEKWFSEIGADVQEKMLASKCKKCPKCKGAIYIDDKVACNHMTCVCGHHFCWLCMQPWANHSGDYYTCNKFNELSAQQDAKVKEARKQYDKAVKQRKFFEHCFDRYLAHDLAFQAASKHLPAKVKGCMRKAMMMFDLSDYKLQFMLDCARELRLCRLALKWSYPYIYSMKEVAPQEYAIVEGKQAKLEKCVR